MSFVPVDEAQIDPRYVYVTSCPFRLWFLRHLPYWQRLCQHGGRPKIRIFLDFLRDEEDQSKLSVALHPNYEELIPRCDVSIPLRDGPASEVGIPLGLSPTVDSDL